LDKNKLEKIDGLKMKSADIAEELNQQKHENKKLKAKLVNADKELEFKNEEKERWAEALQSAKEEIFDQANIIEIQKAYYMDKQLLKSTLESIGDAVISCDSDANIVFMNKVAQSLTGWDLKEAIGKPIEMIFYIVDESDMKKSENIVRNAIIKERIHKLTKKTILITKDGTEMNIEDSVAPIFDENEETVGAVLVFRDVTDKTRNLKHIEYLSYHDEITGLYNRRFYEEELKRMDNERNLPLSLIMADINGLKLINDSFGHEVGDELLIKTANTLQKSCRANDIAARLGGDEFIIIMPNTNTADAEKVMKRIQDYLKKEKVNGLDISLSLGYETKTAMIQDVNDLFKKAEDHMYRQKVYTSSSMRKKTIDLITNTLFEKNRRELIHSQHVRILAEALSKKMGLSDEEVNLMRLVGLMHDIGKIGIADSILNKQGELTPDEYANIRKHPEIGFRILSSVNEFSEMSECVLEHHENWDGTGYPQKLKGEEIKFEARMIAVCDAFDAMVTLRPYHPVFSHEEAMNEIIRCSGSQFDPMIVESFVNMMIDDGKIQFN
jgi:diguanylate cyclase (GGDEF)-like protein/PAS domain S-box-containing protein/putative nucleotidyltransferase with HDIG domain